MLPWIAILTIIAVPLVFNMRRWYFDRQRALAFSQLSRPNRLLFEDSKVRNISFLVAAWNESGTIKRCIQGVLSLPYPNLEMVLCAGGGDGTLALAGEIQDRRLILLEQLAGEGKQRALQRCLEASSGEIIYLIDADCIIEWQNFILCIQPILYNSEEVVSGSFYLPLPEQQSNPYVYLQAPAYIYSSAHRPAYSTGLLGGNCAMIRSVLVDAGGFLNPVPTGTDYDLARRLLRLGKQIRYEPMSYIKSEFPTNFQDYFRQQARWIRNIVILGMQYRAYREVAANMQTSLIGLGMLIVPLIGIFLIFFNGHAAGLAKVILYFWCGFFFHTFLARLRYLAFSRIWPGLHTSKKSLLLIPLFILTDFAAWSLPVLEYPLKSFRQRW